MGHVLRACCMLRASRGVALQARRESQRTRSMGSPPALEDVRAKGETTVATPGGIHPTVARTRPCPKASELVLKPMRGARR